MESIDNVFRQHSQGNSDKFFRKGKRFDKFGQPHISVRFIKRRENYCTTNSPPRKAERTVPPCAWL
ncbi:hypothetical protein GYMC52_3269 [Geobacillus sp. Y412MC52]|nr:hypothetical protein GYMC52_3269 [Geobacillus sp. Y412MC52]